MEMHTAAHCAPAWKRKKEETGGLPGAHSHTLTPHTCLYTPLPLLHLRPHLLLCSEPAHSATTTAATLRRPGMGGEASLPHLPQQLLPLCLLCLSGAGGGGWACLPCSLEEGEHEGRMFCLPHCTTCLQICTYIALPGPLRRHVLLALRAETHTLTCCMLSRGYGSSAARCCASARSRIAITNTFLPRHLGFALPRRLRRASIAPAVTSPARAF